MTIDKKFNILLLLEKENKLPRLLVNGLKFYGISEIPGKQSNPLIMQMAKAIGVEDIYKNDDTSWCALFMCYLLLISKKPVINPGNDKYNLLRAKSFSEWGNPVQRGEEMLGDILVFKRPGGFHVGIYIAESKNTYHVFGGNQNNSVNITEISKTRLVAARRFYATGIPAGVKKYFIDSTGKLSTNEA